MQHHLFRWALAIVALVALPLQAADYDLDYYLPAGTELDPSVPTPAEVLHYEVGEWHVRHDQLVRYMEVLSDHSDRFQMEIIGYSHERRPLILVTVTSAENKDRVEEMRQQHLALTDPDADADVTEAPLVVYLGFSVHGDESSGANASLLTAYYLAAAQGEEVEQWLDNTVILLEPALNPDGLGRFAQWANQFKSQNLVSDSQNIEQQQLWLRGRQNHYWFDLNRDWLLLQHPESRARISAYQRWMPNVLTDHHEMGTNSTYFFQPGIPSRKNPMTPDGNVELTALLAEYHADSLDDVHSLYYTEESFDDFYYGKGSSYPDIQGTIGILFEQASSRGHLQESVNGELSFPFTIRNQFLTSLSTIRGSVENRDRLNSYMQSFYRDSIELASDAGFDGYMLRGDDADPARMDELLNILRQHQIEAFAVSEDFSADGEDYKAGRDFYIPASQRQFRLLEGAFSTRQDFPDNTFYDVSAWTLPSAFNIEFAQVDSTRSFRVSDEPFDGERNWQENQLTETNVGYAFSWEHYFAPRLLSNLLQEDVHVRLAHQPMTIETANGEQRFPAGTALVTRAYQTKEWDQVTNLVAGYANDNQVPVHTIARGLTPGEGMDIGSRSIDPVEMPEVLLVVGDGVPVQEAGETWYYLDRHLNLPVSKIETQRLEQVNIDRYSHIIMVNGRYNFNDQLTNRIRNWVTQGGTLIGQKGGARWMAEKEILGVSFVEQEEFDEQFKKHGLSYGERDQFYAQQRVAGAIFETELDLSHPLAVGYTRQHLPVFKDSTMAMMADTAPFVDVARYREEPVLAGYVSSQNRDVLRDRTSVAAHRFGSGRVVGFADNINFRGFFWGTSKLLANAIFWSQYAQGTTSDDDEAADAEMENAHAH
ncbi:peptidase M14 [Aliidiomarina sedimenti]|uniref:Peptidase M14 n=1 Tax=Aliidiomarina sedimenti TaxID=1933879 RepID=A0ABY0C099_9GAMM|nr:M14 family zinc carboxypeptidase [Aliidiomarina sedimenti]RUO30716.1 peptidase M14 [Aliidiomarina sedimenti]